MQRTRLLALGTAVVVVIAAVVVALVLPGGDDGDDADLTVMTRNLYLGADLQPIFELEAGADILGILDGTWQQILASDFESRARAIANEVSAHQPDLIGLQEVMRYAVSGDEAAGVDFLEILLGALADAGHDYEAVVEQEQFGGTFPIRGATVTLTDRDAIIARADAGLDLANATSGQFDAAFEVPNPLGGDPIRVLRGWTAVNATKDGTTFRFVNTHLEAFEEDARVEQTRELLDGPLATDLPVVLVGDLNSPADEGPAYRLVTGPGGLDDTWSAVGDGSDGLTCCWAGDLRTDDELSSRIDLVLTRDGFEVVGAEVTGDEPGDRVATDRAPAGELWPSDHAGVVVSLEFAA